MPIFKLRPPQVEARQFVKNRPHLHHPGVDIGVDEIIKWIALHGSSASYELSKLYINKDYIAMEGDWIVREGQNFTVMRASAFAEKYEPV